MQFEDIQYHLMVTPIKQVYPNLDEGDTYDYTPLLTSMGFDIVHRSDDDDYSGDSRILYRYDGFFGFLLFGWGSCSGCDALQGCETYDEIEALRRQLFDSIRWGDALDLRKWMVERDWEGDFSYHDGDNTRVFVAESIALLDREIGHVATP